MNNIKENPLKYLKLFSIIYLGATLGLSLLSSFIELIGMVGYLIHGYTSFSQIISLFGSVFGSFFGSVLDVLPFAAFAVYLFVFYPKNKKHIMLPIVFGATCLVTFIEGCSTIVDSIRYIVRMWDWSVFSGIVSIIGSLAGLGFGAIVFLAFAFYTVNCLTKYKFTKFAQWASLVLLALTALSACGTVLFSVIEKIPMFKSYEFYNLMGVSVIDISTIIYWLAGFVEVVAAFTYFIFWKYGIESENTLPDVELSEDSIRETENVQ